jgi:hypothetical protein
MNVLQVGEKSSRLLITRFTWFYVKFKIQDLGWERTAEGDPQRSPGNQKDHFLEGFEISDVLYSITQRFFFSLASSVIISFYSSILLKKFSGGNFLKVFNCVDILTH